MLKGRLKAVGLPEILSPHSFRVLVVTDPLSQNVPLEDILYLVGHAHTSHPPVLRPPPPARVPQRGRADLRLKEGYVESTSGRAEAWRHYGQNIERLCPGLVSSLGLPIWTKLGAVRCARMAL